MSLRAQGGYLLLAAVGMIALAQPRAFSQTEASYASRSQAHYLSRDEALGILSAALDRHHRLPPMDCSHLVHALYGRAGFPYSYLTSYELYAGKQPFRRVSHPQAGDLIVWRGHVGIVVSPQEHTFYSSFSSGPGVEDYDSRYWRNRGQRRFFRYVMSNDVSGEEPMVADAASRNRRASAQLTDAAESISRISDIAPSSPADSPLTVASDPVVRTTRPTTADVQEAVLRSFRDNEEKLRGRDLFKLDRKVAFFDEFRVRKVHIKKEQAWADLQIGGQVSVADARIDEKRHSERVRCALTRTGDGEWQVQLPRDAIYVPREAAPQLLAHQLAVLTAAPSGTDSAVEQSQLAHALETLLH